MGKFILFTDEQKYRANSVDLVDFLERQGEQLIRSGRDMRLKSDPSITVRGNQWYDHSAEQGGLAVRFVQEFYDLSYPEAMSRLLGNRECGADFKHAGKAPPQKRKPFALPEANSDMHRVFAYLLKRRFLDREILTYFAKAKMLYEDKKYHNAVFIGIDEDGVAKHAHKRSTYSKGKSYRANVEGCDPRYSFHHIGTDDTLYVFEAPIDMLSFITLYPKDWQKHSYVALCGVSEHAMLHRLKLNPNLKHIVLCLDHDEGGIEATCRLTEILHEHGYQNISCLRPKYKDWNEILKARNGVQPLPAEEHPKLELLPEVCAALYEPCERLRLLPDPGKMLREEYERLKPLISNGKPTYEVASGHLQDLAASALLAAQKESRQIGQTLAMEQLLKELQDSYRPHQDRGKLRSKADDLQQDLATLHKQLRSTGIRSLEDKQNIIHSYQRLALDSVRVLIFLELKAPKQAVAQMNQSMAIQ